MCEDNLKIVNLSELIETYGNQLKIPDYQRPYTWETSTADTLFNDIYSAIKEKKAYRLGSLILHKEEVKNEDKIVTGYVYNIVDGQQRLTTTALILKALDDESKFLLENEIKAVSFKNIAENYKALESRIKALSDSEKENYKKYIKECSFAVIITNKQEEAFQFFDSQNTRGKSLKPHDLLKAYHLREMNAVSEDIKKAVVKCWDNIDEAHLADLFADYLYPVVRWHKKRDAVYYTAKNIDTFKGISQEYKYNYALYHKRSVMFAEKIEKEFSDFLYNKECNLFQLTQPVISGEHFFKYVFYYDKLLTEVKNMIAEHHKESAEIPAYRTGDIYIKRLYECALLLFIDRFGIENMETSYMEMLYKWSYSLRLIMYAVRRESINSYAKGNNKNINNGALFDKIGEMNKPEDIMKLELKKIEIPDYNKDKYSVIYSKLYNKEGKNE
ncbi:MAG: DUF262 domain-containing protein [Mucispirillum sp.]|nr:DUF262 domain-containing protein [Mucispirillum sp.]